MATKRRRRTFEHGVIIEYGHTYYWVPDDIDPDSLRPRNAYSLDANADVNLDGFGSMERAECWARIQSLGPSYKSNHIDAPDLDEPIYASEIEDVSIPLLVAREGKAKIAAYLYALNASHGAIATGLDVSERTVKQYISDVRRGER